MPEEWKSRQRFYSRGRTPLPLPPASVRRQPDGSANRVEPGWVRFEIGERGGGTGELTLPRSPRVAGVPRCGVSASWRIWCGQLGLQRELCGPVFCVAKRHHEGCGGCSGNGHLAQVIHIFVSHIAASFCEARSQRVFKILDTVQRLWHRGCITSSHRQ